MIEKRIEGLASVPESMRESIVTAWVSAWTSRCYKELDDFPFMIALPEVRLIDHVKDVIAIGRELVDLSRSRWDLQIDPAEFYAILALHDIDKALLSQRREGAVVHSELFYQLPHGVAGALFHGRTAEALMLHYADMLASDRVLLGTHLKPLYQRK